LEWRRQDRFVDLTAARIRRASRLMNPSDPDRSANTLMISLWFTAMGFGAVTLGSPPSFLTEQGWHLGYFDAAPIIWSGMMSIGVASFGANAQAAALKQQKRKSPRTGQAAIQHHLRIKPFEPER